MQETPSPFLTKGTFAIWQAWNLFIAWLVYGFVAVYCTMVLCFDTLCHFLVKKILPGPTHASSDSEF